MLDHDHFCNTNGQNIYAKRRHAQTKSVWRRGTGHATGPVDTGVRLRFTIGRHGKRKSPWGSVEKPMAFGPARVVIASMSRWVAGSKPGV
jgi:hypothetical protein